ncbi:uncharacterized protein C7orf57 homolog [Labrus bergylta]|uniref:uncharacterized protein C7orf57 homolog n=1 Tax=Labrus bergylta TaxID=56723 RepID=UPI003313AA75
MNSEKSTAVMRNELQSTQSGEHGTEGHISQIPGLSPSTSSLPETRVRGRRAGVFDSDSDYIKLAKQGGHRGLLWHENTISSTTKSYKPPDWFTSSRDSGNQSLINGAEKKNPGAFQPLEPPFGTDNMSAWERDDNSNKEKNNNVLDSQMEESTHHQNLLVPHQTSKFKRMVFDKKPSPVNMSKLLSFGYLEDKPAKATTDFSN